MVWSTDQYKMSKQVKLSKYWIQFTVANRILSYNIIIQRFEYSDYNVRTQKWTYTKQQCSDYTKSELRLENLGQLWTN